LVALGEEVLFRGYIQSRLNEAWRQPHDLWGVRWRWGTIITALLFGLWHVLNPWNPLSGASALAWPWGLWTFFLGLILAMYESAREPCGFPCS
jgi:membrane protease YdiL (CAAX protease family)